MMVFLTRHFEVVCAVCADCSSAIFVHLVIKQPPVCNPSAKLCDAAPFGDQMWSKPQRQNTARGVLPLWLRPHLVTERGRIAQFGRWIAYWWLFDNEVNEDGAGTIRTNRTYNFEVAR